MKHLDEKGLEAAAHVLHGQQEYQYDWDRERETFRRQAAEIVRTYMDALDPAPGWQTMDSAPRDGSHFLARQVVVADELDEDDRVLKRGAREEFTVIAYWVWGGIVQFPWNGGVPSNVSYTHWMPLPAAPMSQEG